MPIMQVLRRTYLFILLRLLVVVLTIVPIAFLTDYLGKQLVQIFHVEVSGLVYTVFYLNFALIGCTVGLAVFGLVRKTVLFYVKAAHVIAITKLCTDDSSKCLTLDSFREVGKRFLSINLFYIADGLVKKSIHDIGRLILSQTVAPFINSENVDNSFGEKLKKIFIRGLGGSISKTLNYSDEIVLSYIYIQCRIQELYGQEQEKSIREQVQSTLKHAVDGLCLYIKNCIPLVKEAFITVLSIDIFGWMISIIASGIALCFIGHGIVKCFIIFIVVKVIYAIVSYSFLEPYETAVLVTTFYNAMYEAEENGDLEQIKQGLIHMSAPFKQLFSKAFGENNQEGSMTADSLLDQNLYDVAKDSLKEIFGGKDQDAD